MRASVVLVGLMIIVIGLLLWVDFGYPIEIIGTIGLINIILGLVTPKSPGLALQPEPMGQVKLIVDKARSKSGTYALVFSDTKLIMKKLAGTGAVMAIAFVFAIIGGMVGGATGYSVQEFLVERRRQKIQVENSITTIVNGDIEIPYETMNSVELGKNKLKIASGDNPLTIIMSKKYPPIIGARLRELIPSRAWYSQAQVSM